MGKTLKEASLILFVSIVMGLIANAISQKGIALVGDYSERFAIDSSKSADNFDVSKRGKLNKGGFYEPVNITVDIAKKLYDDNVLFIDGREGHEFAEGHIKGAKNVPYKEFLEKTNEQKLDVLKDIKKDQLIVSYCGSDSCEISIDNAYEMAKVGYSDIKIFLGGYKEWKNKRYPIEK